MGLYFTLLPKYINKLQGARFKDPAEEIFGMIYWKAISNTKLYLYDHEEQPSGWNALE